uniref:Uncharacterized protein n=1 Tax=Knipowitschia caucasica TaxID=637954 RepID=A0AAV2J4N0_KNICA
MRLEEAGREGGGKSQVVRIGGTQGSTQPRCHVVTGLSRRGVTLRTCPIIAQAPRRIARQNEVLSGPCRGDIGSRGVSVCKATHKGPLVVMGERGV